MSKAGFYVFVQMSCPICTRSLNLFNVFHQPFTVVVFEALTVSDLISLSLNFTLVQRSPLITIFSDRRAAKVCVDDSRFPCSLVTLVISALYRKSYSQQRHRLGKSVLKTRPLVPSPPRGGHWDPDHHPRASATNERMARCSVAVCLHDNTVPEDGISAASGLPEADAGGSESASKTPATTDVTLASTVVWQLEKQRTCHVPHESPSSGDGARLKPCGAGPLPEGSRSETPEQSDLLGVRTRTPWTGYWLVLSARAETGTSDGCIGVRLQQATRLALHGFT
ncbi:unnamed protein product [Ixodes persulcatus]